MRNEITGKVMARGEPGTFALDYAAGIDVVRADCLVGSQWRELKKCYHATAGAKIDVSLCERYIGILDTC
jgi:hypothetical protein